MEKEILGSVLDSMCDLELLDQDLAAAHLKSWRRRLREESDELPVEHHEEENVYQFQDRQYKIAKGI